MFKAEDWKYAVLQPMKKVDWGSAPLHLKPVEENYVLKTVNSQQ